MSAVVTQADREVLKAIYAPAAHEAIDAGDYDSHQDAQAIARHRSEAVEELVEVLERTQAFIRTAHEPLAAMTDCLVSAIGAWKLNDEQAIDKAIHDCLDRIAEAVASNSEALISKHRGEQG